MPLIALDAISGFSLKHLEEKVLANANGNTKELKAKNDAYLSAYLSYRKRLEAIGKELKFL